MLVADLTPALRPSRAGHEDQGIDARRFRIPLHLPPDVAPRMAGTGLDLHANGADQKVDAILFTQDSLALEHKAYAEELNPEGFLSLSQATGYTGDLNSLAATGLQKLGVGVTNGPSGAGAGDFVLTLYHDASTATQLLLNNGTVALISARAKSSGVWGAWVDAVLTAGDQTIAGNKTLSGVTALSGGATAAGVTTTSVSDGTPVAASTYRPDPLAATPGNMRHITNGAAFTLAAPNRSGDYTMTVLVTNGAGAGAITMSGFAKVLGDPFTTTNGHAFLISIVKQGAVILATVQAGQ